MLYQRARPDLRAFVDTAAPVRPGRPRADEVFDLSALPTRCRLELALVLQASASKAARTNNLRVCETAR